MADGYRVRRHDALLQLRALMRAGEGRALRMAVPAVVDPLDLTRVREALDNAREELRLEGMDVSNNPQLGVIFETPASALLGRELMVEADFALLGLDAFCEHLAGSDADSRDPIVRTLATRPHPAVLRAIRKLLQLAEGRDLELTVYGERLAEGAWIPLLTGLGARRFALRPGILREVHGRLGGIDLDLCEGTAERASRSKSAEEVAALLPGSWSHDAS